jgi:hypothetical protein
MQKNPQIEALIEDAVRAVRADLQRILYLDFGWGKVEATLWLENGCQKIKVNASSTHETRLGAKL